MPNLSPSSLGFHCDGECWEEAGSAEGLIKWLAHDTKLRDWFVLASWAEESPQLHMLPPMASVHPIQDYINEEALEKYKLGSMGAAKKSYEQYPVLFSWMGKTFIFQGTHRLAALYTAHADSFKGYKLSLTSAM